MYDKNIKIVNDNYDWEIQKEKINVGGTMHSCTGDKGFLKIMKANREKKDEILLQQLIYTSSFITL